MTEMLVTTLLLSILGFGLRMWFMYASVKAIRGPRRDPARDPGDIGLSFDERVAQRLSELPSERTASPTTRFDR
jgi:hypothetical protein